MKNVVWRVKIGHNWATYSVLAVDVGSACKKALALAKRDLVDTDNRWISEVVLVAEIDR
jgi:hypothetical protein